MHSAHSRRRLLAAASSVCLVALAGCSGGADDPDESDDQGPDDAGNGTDNESDGDETAEDDEPTGDDESTPPEPVDWTGEDQGTVAVGPGGDTKFEPDAVRIRPGTTVRWLWESDGHSVVPVDQPDGGGWGGEPEISGEGHSHEFTFETPGTYEYVCEPHEDSRMRGRVVVAED